MVGWVNIPEGKKNVNLKIQLSYDHAKPHYMWYTHVKLGKYRERDNKIKSILEVTSDLKKKWGVETPHHPNVRLIKQELIN